MSEKKHDDGGPAFACAAENGHQAGMSLRDWFAGQALCGLTSNPEYTRGLIKETGLFALTENAGQIADAMLAERAKARGEK